MSADESACVLVVDDSLDMAEMLADDLCDRGYRGIGVASGEEALHVLRSERVDALVTDVTMPTIDGFTLLRASIRLDPSRPVILMTAYGSLDAALEASGRGAYHYILKPFRTSELVQVLARALERR